MDVLRYTPVTDQDFGTLSCWGVNEVGLQQNPCLFQVVLAGKLENTRIYYQMDKQEFG